MGLNKGSKLDDGWLEFSIVKTFPKWKAAYIAYMFTQNKLQDTDYVETHSVKSLKIHSTQLTHSQIDGDPFVREKDFEIQIVPASLKVVIP